MATDPKKAAEIGVRSTLEELRLFVRFIEQTLDKGEVDRAVEQAYLYLGKRWGDCTRQNIGTAEFVGDRYNEVQLRSLAVKKLRELEG